MERKRKHRYKKSLKKFTKDNSKKSKNGDRKYKGWSEGGKKFVLETVVIKEKEDNGMRLKWEETYRQLLDVMKGAEASKVDEEDNDIVEVDYSMLYEEV
jgi:hypothetical protein